MKATVWYNKLYESPAFQDQPWEIATRQGEDQPWNWLPNGNGQPTTFPREEEAWAYLWERHEDSGWEIVKENTIAQEMEQLREEQV